MNRKLLLVAGVAAAAVALALLQTWQSSVIEDYSPGRDLTVLVAATALEKGKPVKARMFERRQMSEHVLAHVPHAITPKDLHTVEGQTLDRPLRQGEILRLTDFGGQMRSGSLAQRVPPNMRAVPLPVDELNAFSGLIQPGDRIDIMAYVHHPGMGKEVMVSFLDDVQVLATGERMVPGAGFGRGGTVTLLLDRQSAAELSLAQRSGELVFLLRNPEDQAPATPVDEITADSLVTPVVRKERRARPRPPAIKIRSASSQG